MSGLTRDYIERNIVAELREMKRRLATLERGSPALEAAIDNRTIVYDESTGDPYRLYVRVIGGSPVLFVTPLVTTTAGAEAIAEAMA